MFLKIKLSLVKLNGFSQFDSDQSYIFQFSGLMKGQNSLSLIGDIFG